MENIPKKTIISIPGLGGHQSVFKGYEEILADFDICHMSVINWKEAQDEIEILAAKMEPVILLCNCYGLQTALRLIDTHPNAVESVVVVEPFFAEYFWWAPIANFFNRGIIALMKLTDRLKIRRKKFKQNIDYNYLSKYPMFCQPIFDMQHQNLTDYFGKIDDILNFKLPEEVNAKILFIFSPKGFVRGSVRERMLKIFKNSKMIEIGKGTHNIVTVSWSEVANTINDWLK